MSAMVSQITGVSIVFSTVFSGADHRKHQGSSSLAFVRGIDWWSVDSPNKGPATRKMFSVDDGIMLVYEFVFSVMQVPCAGLYRSPAESPTKRSERRGFDVFFSCKLEKHWTKGGIDWDTMALMWRDCNEVIRTSLTAYLPSPWHPVCITFALKGASNFPLYLHFQTNKRFIPVCFSAC